MPGRWPVSRTSIRRRALALLLGALIAYPLPAFAQSVSGKAKVVDGDSLEIREHRIRLWGIDAPEFKQTCVRGEQRWDCGYAATDALRRHLEGATVKCVTVDKDDYGRLVAKCSKNQRSVNEWLVREGWATDFTRYSQGAYADAQCKARSAKRGIWSGTFETPERYRHRR